MNAPGAAVSPKRSEDSARPTIKLSAGLAGVLCTFVKGPCNVEWSAITLVTTLHWCGVERFEVQRVAGLDPFQTSHVTDENFVFAYLKLKVRTGIIQL